MRKDSDELPSLWLHPATILLICFVIGGLFGKAIWALIVARLQF